MGCEGFDKTCRLPHLIPLSSHSFQLSGVDFLCFFVVGLGFPFLFGVFLPHLFR